MPMRKKGRQLRKNIAGKDVLHYILAMGCTIVFALYCSGRVGWFLFAMLGIAPFFSVVIAWGFSKAMTYRVSLEKTVYCKKEKGSIVLLFHNRLRFPMAFIHIVLSCENGVKFEGALEQCRMEKEVTVGVSREESVELFFQTFSAGEASFRAESVEIFDMFHIVSFPLRFEGKKQEYSIGILPEIVERTENPLCNQALLLTAADSEPDEDTVEKSTNQFGGFPGFEHRQYLPGDPVKRINWKLSAKKGELFVRLDEQQGGSGVAVILDPYANQEALLRECTGRLRSGEAGGQSDSASTRGFRFMASTRNRVESVKVREDQELICSVRGASIERAISHLVYFLANDLSVQFYWYTNRGWRKTVVSEPTHLNALCEELAWVHFQEKDENRVPEEAILDPKCKAFLYCTTFQDEALSERLEKLKQKTQCTFLVSAVWEDGK